MKSQPVIFEEHRICRLYDETTERWFFPMIDGLRSGSLTIEEMK